MAAASAKSVRLVVARSQLGRERMTRIIRAQTDALRPQCGPSRMCSAADPRAQLPRLLFHTENMVIILIFVAFERFVQQRSFV